ncbi:MAG TPA: energy transducer TonB [Thermoanaerobaculia bacterium]|nr:energy transducer TonB [Thermoanaerobaculia bacterium]
MPPTPIPPGGPPRRLIDPPSVFVSRLPADNPFGITVEEPAVLPPKPSFQETTVPAALFAAVRVDPAGKVVQSRIVRDPIPSLAAESRRSFEQRWSFDPAVKGGQPIETWASVRLDLQVEVRPRDVQATLTPVTAATPLPAPFEWGDDTKWYEGFRVNFPTDGTVPLEQADKLPVPKKTKWSADSYKGPFSCRFWIKVSAAGRVEKTIPIQASDAVLVPYMRRALSTWSVQPARVKGKPVESWNELSLTGQISYSIDVKQINNLRKTLATP